MQTEADAITRGMALAADELYAAGLHEAARVILLAIRKRQFAAREVARKATA
jgi:hypothetical protein